jgi:hypothetical protein
MRNSCNDRAAIVAAPAQSAKLRYRTATGTAADVE